MESWGTGVWKAKQSLRENGSPGLRFEEFEDNVDITSVTLFENENYRRICMPNKERDSIESLQERNGYELVNIMYSKGKKSASKGKKYGQNGKKEANHPTYMPPKGKKSDSKGKKWGLRILDTAQNTGREGTQVLGNKATHKDRISASHCSPTITKSLLSVVDYFYDRVFGWEDISSSLGCSRRTATNYISYLVKMGLIELVNGVGKGKYHFIP